MLGNSDIQIRLICLPHMTFDGDIKVGKIGKNQSRADLATKADVQKKTSEYLKACGFDLELLRSKLALAAAVSSLRRKRRFDC